MEMSKKGYGWRRMDHRIAQADVLYPATHIHTFVTLFAISWVFRRHESAMVSWIIKWDLLVLLQEFDPQIPRSHPFFFFHEFSLAPLQPFSPA